MSVSNQASIGDLMTGMKQLAESVGGKDLQLSSTAHQNYINLIQEYRTALAEQYGNAARLADYGNVPNLISAVDTLSNLTNDVHGADGLLARLKYYMDYLDEFEKTVNAAFSRMQAEDHGS